MIVIIYTTKYREGSDKFEQAAITLNRELSEIYKNEIFCRGIAGKKELVHIFNRLTQSEKQIDSFYFIGHSGMYGPMFGTVSYPEQFSPYELRNLKIPFSKNAKAYFYCCRSARWFAPFFARTFNVETFGFYNYTTISSNKIYYRKFRNQKSNAYIAGCIGRKSHGLIGSLLKRSGFLKLEKIKSYKPTVLSVDTTYNSVSDIYNKTFSNIKVRIDEWNWISSSIPKENQITLLDIGCGNGALLNELSGRIKAGIGVDTSIDIIDKAIILNTNNKNISFFSIEGPFLPIADSSVDIIISLLSFRYLDWDPIMDEIKRVLKPNGRILIVDMVTVPLKLSETGLFIRSKIKHYKQRFNDKVYYKNLRKLVENKYWTEMLKFNPIRAEHEMKWYLESRFPGRKVKKINAGWNSCILAFDSGNISNIKDIHLTYP